MPSYYLSPIGNDQQIDSNGAPLSGGKIFTYLAGTSTPSATYTDNTGTTPQANPIILNSLGLPASPIWLLGGFPLKFIIKDSTDTTIRTVDNISGINDTSSTASEWTSSGLTPTYISATQFSVVGDQTSIFQVNRRVRTTNTGGLIYGRITVSAFGSGITTVTVVNDTGSMDSGLSAVAYGFLSFSPSSVPYNLYMSVGDSAQTVSKVQAISAAVAASALTISASATILDFRSATLGSGAVTTVSGTPANLVVPSTATLGTTSASLSRLAVLALNNAGTIELAVVNALGGTDLSESGLVTTTAITAASNSASVVYSTTARTDVAYRVLGYIESTQATAGTWATAPSTIQGQGGNALQGVPRMQQSPSVTASGTSVDFTGIAPWAREIAVPIAGISTNGSSPICIQIGDAGGIETSGYTSTYNNIAGGAAATSTAAVGLMITATAASVYSGHIFLNLINPATNLWAVSGLLSDSSPTIQIGCGSKALSGPLDRIRITTIGGANTFDAGTLSAISKGY